MRLCKIQEFMEQKRMPYRYHEEEGCGSIDFEHRGLSYHIWEYRDDTCGVESNIRCCGRSEDYEGDYEEQIIAIMETW